MNHINEILNRLVPGINTDDTIAINSADGMISYDGYNVVHLTTKLNDLKNINETLELIYNHSHKNSYLVISYIKQPRASIRNLKAIWTFFFKRALPKLPLIHHVANASWNRKNKFLSKAEVWGRLIFNSYDILEEDEIDGLNFVFCKKTVKLNIKSEPSFYPIIKLRRVGYRGEIIYTYKVRSMFPYSEYVQKKIFEMNSLSGSGKISDDFRITEYGKFIRKIWVDELPQIINLIKHDIKLVGIRAMSEHYFSLYPEEYKELYKKVRPGFLSPLYDNTTFATIIATEKRYLEEYIKNPVKTDFKYFFIIIWDILRGKRSN